MKRVLSASEFKAKCLAYLGEIEQSGEAITITRRGRPIAVLGPVRRAVSQELNLLSVTPRHAHPDSMALRIQKTHKNPTPNP